MNSFIAELRRRNMFRLAATYALVAWILIEAGDVLLPTFGFEDWVFRAYVIAVFVGFFLSLVLAWVFEVTPEGVKFDHEVDRDQQPPRNKGRSNAIIITLLALALAVSITFNVTGLRERQAEAEVAARGSDNSVAVLPFTSRSTDPENRFFADGIHDDLLARLAGVESLRVISRTSVNEYRNTDKNVRQIGAELGATAIVEGSVQRSGDKVRITVTLIDAASDGQIWAQSYDRALTIDNVFDIQSEISSQIAAALSAALTPEEARRLLVMPTNSIEALAKYSAARNNLYQRRYETLVEARRQFEEAVTIDPGYAQAWAGLAETVIVTHTNHQAIPPDEAYAIAEDAISRALDIDPQLAEAWAVKGLLEHHRWLRDRLGGGNQEAATAFERAIQLNPNLANAYVWYASLLENENRIEEAVEMLHKAINIDPLGRIPYINLPGFYSALGQNDKAIEFLLRAIEIFPDWASPYASMTNQLLRLGRLDEAVAWMQLAESLTNDPMVGREAVGAYIEFGDLERLQAFSANFPPGHPLHSVGEGFRHFMNNEFEQTIAALRDATLPHEIERDVTYPLIAMAATSIGDYELARDVILHANPLLASDSDASVDRYNLRSAILLAYVLRRLERDRQASDLLNQAWEITERLPRVGSAGHGIADVHILAIQGRKEAALNALRAAIDEGFVSLMAFDFWTLDQDVLIDTLRDDPRFEAMRLELHEKIDQMRENVRRADESGDWSELTNRVRGRLTARLRP